VNSLETIPDYFFANSIAIIFQKVGAFVSTLTAVANLTSLILPELNLGFLANKLREKPKL